MRRGAAAALADGPRLPGRGRRIVGFLVLAVLAAVVGGLLPWWACSVVGWILWVVVWG